MDKHGPEIKTAANKRLGSSCHRLTTNYLPAGFLQHKLKIKNTFRQSQTNKAPSILCVGCFNSASVQHVG